MVCPSLHREIERMIKDEYVDLCDFHPWAGRVLNTVRTWCKFSPIYEDVPYFTCDVIDEHGYECPYQAMFCEYKEQEEKIEEILLGGIFR